MQCGDLLLELTNQQMISRTGAADNRSHGFHLQSISEKERKRGAPKSAPLKETFDYS